MPTDAQGKEVSLRERVARSVWETSNGPWDLLSEAGRKNLLDEADAAIALVLEAPETRAHYLRKHARLVREMGPSGSPGALASAMERRADSLHPLSSHGEKP